MSYNTILDNQVAIKPFHFIQVIKLINELQDDLINFHFFY